MHQGLRFSNQFYADSVQIKDADSGYCGTISDVSGSTSVRLKTSHKGYISQNGRCKTESHEH